MPIDPHELAGEGGKKVLEVVAETGLSGIPVKPVKKSSDRSLFLYTAIAIGIALLVRFFIAAPYMVSGPSMEETFHNHDYLIIDRLSYRIETPQRGDVVVFKRPQNTAETLIKRVIGLPGDTVTLKSGQVAITNADTPKGMVLKEPYI